MTRSEKCAVQRLALAILEAVNESGSLGGSIWGYVCSNVWPCKPKPVPQYYGAISARGFLEESYNCYFITDAGRAFMSDLRVRIAGLEAA